MADTKNLRCLTCRHWSNPLLSWTDPVRVEWRRGGDKEHESNQAAITRQYGTCGNAAENPDDWRPDDPLPNMVVRDASDYQATLYTRRDFGCVDWEPKNVK